MRRPEHNYIAVIGGDIHNYQRYPVTLADGRTIQYIVSGAGGAFMHATHSIERIDLAPDAAEPVRRVPREVGPVTESDFRCYPLRGDSLSMYSQIYGRKFRWFGGRRLFIAPDEAAAIAAERLGIPATRASARQVAISKRSRRMARILFHLPGRAHGALHLPFSEFLDWNDPPLFKSFLRIDASEDQVRIRCFGVNGCADQQDNPPVEDAVRADRNADGEWRWSNEEP